MSVGEFFFVAALLVGFFWVVGKLFIKLMRFVLITALGVAVVCAIFVSPIYLLYGVGIALFGLYSAFARLRARRARGLAGAAPKSQDE